MIFCKVMGAACTHGLDDVSVCTGHDRAVVERMQLAEPYKVQPQRLIPVDLFGHVINIVDGALNNTFDFLPLNIQPTTKCNCNCVGVGGCCSGDVSTIDPLDDLDYSLYSYILDTLNDKKLLRTIHFTGGEPMLHPLFGRMLNNCQLSDKLVTLDTNGTKPFVNAALLSRIDWINVLCYNQSVMLNCSAAQNQDITALAYAAENNEALVSKLRLRIPVSCNTITNVVSWFDVFPHINNFMFQENATGQHILSAMQTTLAKSPDFVHVESVYYAGTKQAVYRYFDYAHVQNNHKTVTLFWPSDKSVESPGVVPNNVFTKLILSPRGLSGSWNHDEQPILTIGRWV